MDEDAKHIINVREMKGVDLNANARIENPGSYQSTLNMYARVRGMPEVRLGSVLISKTVLGFPSNPGFTSIGTRVAATPVESVIGKGWKL